MKGSWGKMKKSHIIIIAVLAVSVIALSILSIALYLKNEYLEEIKEIRDSYIQSDNNTNINDQVVTDDNSKEENTNQENNNNTNNNDNNDNNNYISKDEALQIVFKDLNIKQNDVLDLSSELEYKYGTQVYEIDFKYNRYEYDYYVDAKTGKIVKSFKERD